MSCINCDLKNKVEDFRRRLDHIIVQKNFCLLNEEVVKLSQELDQLLYKCIFCEKELNKSSHLKLSLDNIRGTHTTFYYYGEKHLFVNLYFYILEGIKNNEIIYLFMEQHLYDKLLELLKKNHISVEHIKFKNVKGLITANKKDGLDGLKKQIKKIGLDDEVKNYSGIRWIGQPSCAIRCSSQEDFLSFEENLNEALYNTDASLLCIYDAYDYLLESKYINPTVIKESIETHDYILKDLILESIE